MARTIRIQPISGKFTQYTSHGNTISIWLVDPDTKEQGTEVSYDDAIELLSLRHPLFCEAQVKGKDGKFIKQLTEDDWKVIREKKESNLKTVTENTLHPTNAVAPTSSDPAMAKLIETQSKLIETQAAQLKAMQNSFTEMQKNMEKLMKSSSKKAKAEKE